MDTLIVTEQLRDLLQQLIDTPNMRPFVFRTRFERVMIRLASYAKDTQQIALYSLSQNSLNRMKNIIDKSNATSDGTLRSYALLIDDMKQLLEYVS